MPHDANNCNHFQPEDLRKTGQQHIKSRWVRMACREKRVAININKHGSQSSWLDAIDTEKWSVGVQDAVT